MTLTRLLKPDAAAFSAAVTPNGVEVDDIDSAASTSKNAHPDDNDDSDAAIAARMEVKRIK